MDSEHTRYACEHGGELVLDQATFGQSSAAYSHGLEQTEYRFNQCRLNLGGEQTLNGAMMMFRENRSDSWVNSTNHSARWTDFEWLKADGFALIIDASIKVENFASDDSNSSRKVNINRYESSTKGQISASVHEGGFLLSCQTSLGEGVQDYSLKADGLVTDQSSVPVRITTEPTMSRRLVSNRVNVESVPFNGQINMVAEDGSHLVLEATSASDTTTLQVNTTFTVSLGNVTAQKAQNFVDLVISAF